MKKNTIIFTLNDITCQYILDAIDPDFEGGYPTRVLLQDLDLISGVRAGISMLNPGFPKLTEHKVAEIIKCGLESEENREILAGCGLWPIWKALGENDHTRLYYIYLGFKNWNRLGYTFMVEDYEYFKKWFYSWGYSNDKTMILLRKASKGVLDTYCTLQYTKKKDLIISQKDEEGNVIRKYHSLKEVEDAGFNKSNVSACYNSRGSRRSAGGYYWYVEYQQEE